MFGDVEEGQSLVARVEQVDREARVGIGGARSSTGDDVRRLRRLIDDAASREGRERMTREADPVDGDELMSRDGEDGLEGGLSRLSRCINGA